MQTRRDGQIVAWIGCIGAASAEHVGERFGMGRSSAYARLASLTADGLLEHRAVLCGWPGMYSATRRGLRWQGLERLRTFRVRPGSFEHTWHVASAAVALHRQLPGWEVLAEREVKVREIDSGKPFASTHVHTPGAHPMAHQPDLAVVSPSGRVLAIEVELTVKAPRRLERICRGWSRARHVDHVYYLATPNAARAVRRAVRKTFAAECVSVLALEDVAGLATHELGRDEEREGLAGDAHAAQPGTNRAAAWPQTTSPDAEQRPAPSECDDWLDRESEDAIHEALASGLLTDTLDGEYDPHDVFYGSSARDKRWR